MTPQTKSPAVGLCFDRDGAVAFNPYNLASRRSLSQDRWCLVYLWRAVDAEGEVLDVLVQTRRNNIADTAIASCLDRWHEGVGTGDSHQARALSVANASNAFRRDHCRATAREPVQDDIAAGGTVKSRRPPGQPA